MTNVSDGVFVDAIPSLDECDFMRVEEWMEQVTLGGLIDYDGMGCASNGSKMAKEYIYPSTADRLPQGTTHIVWFNR